jgi:transposase
MQVTPLLIGVDVSKAQLSITTGDGVQTLANEPAAIRGWLRSLTGQAELAVEATNTFHLALVEHAHARGHVVYLVDGYRLSRYRDSIGGRAKTDRTDAELLLRYLQRERQDLRPWTPPPPGYRSVQRLLHRRATLVQLGVSVRQSLADVPELRHHAGALLERLQRLEALIGRRIGALLREFNAADDASRLRAIEGVGPLTAAALATAFRRGRFRSSDAFIAFLGLDVRVRESGRYQGRRRLTKQGDPELRRLLHNAAMAAARSAHWRPFYQRYLERGLRPTQVLVILARKLARVAFALMKNQSDYIPTLTLKACPQT